MPRLWRRTLLLVAMCIAAACGRQAFTGVDGQASPTAIPSLTVTPTSPGSTPTPPVTHGNGSNGALEIKPFNVVVFLLCGGVNASHQSLTLTTAGSPGLHDGQLVLLAQMQVALGSAIAGSSLSFTTSGSASLDGVGHFEFATVADTSSGVTLAQTLSSAYVSNATARAQVCKVPQFTTVTIDANAAMQPVDWNGSSGGLLAFLASDSLVVTGALRVDSAGFAGGSIGSPNGPATDITVETTANTFAGGKGEGFYQGTLALAGRGALANAAGGGNASCAGGGGGGGGGRGGFGGAQRASDPAGPDPSTRGRGGGSVVASVSQALLPGGGGGASQSVSGTDTPGAGSRGGGVLFVHANAISGSGIISANGAGGLGNIDGGGASGAGGGGGGGVVWLIADQPGDFAGTIAAVGGSGGNVTSSSGSNRGPGGGGGGGRIRLQGVSTHGGAVELSGGVPGVDLHTGQAAAATAGDPGILESIP